MRDVRRLIPPPVRRKRPSRSARRADQLSAPAVCAERAAFLLDVMRALCAHVAAGGECLTFAELCLVNDVLERQIETLIARADAQLHPPLKLVVNHTEKPT